VSNSGDSCIFCLIARGDEPAALVYRDDRVLAFMDLFPLSRGHLLVVPRAHAENIFDISEADMLAVAALQQKIAEVLKAELEPDGIAVYQANGTAAGQTVFHYHVHLIPREDGEGFDFANRKAADRGELSRLAARLMESLQRGPQK
jgi:histidine triad (HIT) family protein